MAESPRFRGRDGAIIAAMEKQFPNSSEPKRSGSVFHGYDEALKEISKALRPTDARMTNYVAIHGHWRDELKLPDFEEWGSAVAGKSTAMSALTSAATRSALLGRLSRELSEVHAVEARVNPEWLARVEEPADRSRVETDIEYVMTRLERVYTRRQAKIWMDSYNDLLNAKPIDFLIFRSVADVIRAVEVVEQQAY